MKQRKRFVSIVLIIILLAGLLYAARDVIYQINSGQCRQCGRCVVACPNQAIYPETTDWKLQIDPELCNGCGLCLDACPFGAIYSVTGNSDTAIAPLSVRLRCHPNPIVDQTVFSFDLPRGEKRASITLHNVKGQLIRTYSVDQSKTIIWDGTDLQGRAVPCGMYIATLSAGKESSSIKIKKVHP